MVNALSTGWLARLVLHRRGHRLLARGPRALHAAPSSLIAPAARGSSPAPAPALMVSTRALSTSRPVKAAVLTSVNTTPHGQDIGEAHGGATRSPSPPRAASKRRGMRKRAGGGGTAARTASNVAADDIDAGDGAAHAVAAPRRPVPEVVPPPAPAPNGHGKRTAVATPAQAGQRAEEHESSPLKGAAAAKQSGKGVMTANHLLAALVAKKQRRQQQQQQQFTQKPTSTPGKAETAKAVATALPFIKEDEEGQHGTRSKVAEVRHTTSAPSTVRPAATATAVKARTPSPEKGTPKMAGTAAEVQQGEQHKMEQAEEEEGEEEGPSPLAAPAPRGSASRNNRATKRRAGQSRGRGRKRSRREGDVAERAEDVDAAGAAGAAFSKQDAGGEPQRVSQQDGTCASSLAEMDAAEQAGDDGGEDDDVAAAAAAAEAQAAIDAAVEAAMAADEDEMPLDAAEEEEGGRGEGEVTTPSAAAAPAAAARKPAPSTATAAPTAKKRRRKGKRKSKRTTRAEAAAAGQADSTAPPHSAAGAETVATADDDKIVAEEGREEDVTGIKAGAAATGDGEGDEDDVAAQEMAAAAAADEAATVEEALTEMEQIFADSWLPPRGKRAVDREAAEEDEGEAAAEVARGDESSTLAVPAAVPSVDHVAATQKEQHAAAKPTRVVKGKRRAKQRIAAAAASVAATAEPHETKPSGVTAWAEVAADEGEAEMAEMVAAAAQEAVPTVSPLREGTHGHRSTTAASRAIPRAQPAAKKKRKKNTLQRNRRRLQRLVMQQLKKILAQQKLTIAAVGLTAPAAAPNEAADTVTTTSVPESSAEERKEEVAVVAETVPPAAARKKKAAKKRRAKGESAAAAAAVREEEEGQEAAGTEAPSKEAKAAAVAVVPEVVDGSNDDDAASAQEVKELEAEMQRIAAELLRQEEDGAEPTDVGADSSSGETTSAETPAANAKPCRKSLRAMILQASSGGTGNVGGAVAAAGAKKPSPPGSERAGKAGGGGGGGGGASAGGGKRKSNPLFFPDYREQVLIIFQQLADINAALGERYKTASYTTATEKLKKNDTIFKILPPHLQAVDEKDLAASGKKEEVLAFMEKRKYVRDATRPIPGVGDKLRKKIVEVLESGDLKELHTLKQKPLIRAIQELTQVHGFGPRTAISFYKDYGISSVEQLKAYAIEQGEDLSVAPPSSPMASPTAAAKSTRKKGFHLTDAQRLGLTYYEEIQQRIPHAEGRLHEAYLKLKVRKHLGKNYDITVCGSFRRRCDTSGDIDVLITPKTGLHNATASSSAEDPLAVSKNALAAFVAALKAEGYIEANLAQGPTKFMGICRLRSLSAPPGSGGRKATRKFCARRIDIRFVDAASFPAALLYFTGSKNFNVVMRAEAIKKNFILNEYGLFKNNSKDFSATSKLHEMISKLAKAQFYSSKSALKSSGGRKGAASSSASAAAASGKSALTDGGDDSEGGEEDDEDEESSAAAPGGAGRRTKELSKQQLAELKEISRKVESLRVQVAGEKDIFDAIGMDYVKPVDRNI